MGQPAGRDRAGAGAAASPPMVPRMLADLLWALRARCESPQALRLGLGLYALVLALGLKRFVVWDQILVLEDAGLWDTVFSGHPHTLRWLVMQPVLAFARLGYDPDLAFTVLGYLCVAGAAYLLAGVAARAAATPAAEARLRLPCLLALAGLSLAMNGRLLPAFFGLSLVLAVAGAGLRPAWLIAGQLTGLLYASVSSGTFAVAGAVCAATWFGQVAADARLRRIGLGICAVTAVLIAGFAVKALRHFGGDPLGVLGHGPGAYLLRLPPGVALAVAAGTAVVLAAVVWRFPFPPAQGRLLRFAVAAALVLGVFGWATLTMAAVPLLALAAAALVAPRRAAATG